MEGWNKIATFERLHEAEIRKNLLQSFDINAVIVNEKDSSFLFGDVELWVEEKNAKEAAFLVEEFIGWSKINSFVRGEQLENLQKILEDNLLETRLLRKSNNKYLRDNFELYVRNEDFLRAKYIINNLANEWTIVSTCESIKQVENRVWVLEQKNIKSIVIKKRDASYNTIEVDIYVPTQNIDEATKLLTELPGWEIIEASEGAKNSQVRLNLLDKEGIQSIIIVNRDKNGNISDYQLFAKNEDAERAKEILTNQRHWSMVFASNKQIRIEALKLLLEEKGIESVLLNEFDRSFLIGQMELWVEDSDVVEAIEIVKAFETELNQ